MNFHLALAGAALCSVVLLSGCASDESSKTSADSKSTTSTETKEIPPTKAPPTQVSPQPLFAGGLLKGDANPKFADGDPGKIAVIAQATLDKSPGMDSATLVFAFRNNTDQTIGGVDWTATARSGGDLVATGSNQGWSPAVIGPGEVGLSYIYFEAGGNIPDTGATYEFTPKPREAQTGEFGDIAPLEIGEYSRKGKTIVGSATNKTGQTVNGPIGVDVYCIDGDNLTGHTQSYAEEDSVESDGTVNFTVTLYDECKTFTISASGYFF